MPYDFGVETRSPAIGKPTAHHERDYPLSRLGIADLLASCLHDERDPASTTHTYADMIRARMAVPAGSCA